MPRPTSLATRDLDRRVSGVQYVELASGVLSFVCSAYRCRLRPSACAKRWRKAEAEGDRPVNHFSIHPEDAHGDLSRCGGCPLGAQHAGLPKPPYRSLLAKDPGLCLRCGHGGARLVGGRACISCYNRGQEYLRGSNGKGTAPVFALRVAPLSLAYSVDGGLLKTRKVSQAADEVEVALDILRRQAGKAVFFPADADAMCATPQRAAVRLRRITLEKPIAGHVAGVVAEDDPTWKAPLTGCPPRRVIVAAERKAAVKAAPVVSRRPVKVEPSRSAPAPRVSKLVPVEERNATAWVSTYRLLIEGALAA